MTYFKNDLPEGKEFDVEPTECCRKLSQAYAAKHTACMMNMVGWVLEQTDEVDDLATRCCYTIRKAHGLNHTKCVERMLHSWLWIVSHSTPDSEDDGYSGPDDRSSDEEDDVEAESETKCCRNLYDAGKNDHYDCILQMVDFKKLDKPILKECCKSRWEACNRYHIECLVNIYRYRYFDICVPTECCKNIRQAVHKCHFECFEKIGKNLPREEPENKVLKELFEPALVHELRYMRNLPDHFIQKRFGHLDYYLD